MTKRTLKKRKNDKKHEKNKKNTEMEETLRKKHQNQEK